MLPGNDWNIDRVMGLIYLFCKQHLNDALDHIFIEFLTLRPLGGSRSPYMEASCARKPSKVQRIPSHEQMAECSKFLPWHLQVSQRKWIVFTRFQLNGNKYLRYFRLLTVFKKLFLWLDRLWESQLLWMSPALGWILQWSQYLVISNWKFILNLF